MQFTVVSMIQPSPGGYAKLRHRTGWCLRGYRTRADLSKRDFGVWAEVVGCEYQNLEVPSRTDQKVLKNINWHKR